MRRSVRILVLFTFCLVAIGIVACDDSPTETPVLPTPTPAPPSITPKPTVTLLPTVYFTPVPTSTPTPIPPGNVLFQDDFSSTDSGWLGGPNAFGWSGYDNRSYLYVVTKPNQVTTMLLPYYNFDNTRMEADVAFDKDTSSAAAGLICRGQANKQQLLKGYKFLVLPNGGYGILEQTGTEASDVKLLVQDQKANVIDAGGVNHIAVDCTGDHLALYANGIKLGEATDDDLTGGLMGFAVNSLPNQSNAAVRFDNLVVRELAAP